MTHRVVTGHRDGKAVFISEGPSPGHVFEHVPGMASFQPWATPPLPTIPMSNQPEAVTETTRLLPLPGGTSFLILHVPCDSIVTSPGFNAEAAGKEWQEHAPEILATHELDNPGMHRTDTIDYFVLLEGELYIELDDNEERCIRKHDVVVMNGTRHAWRNKGEKPALLAAILIGATRVPVDGAPGTPAA